VTTVRKHAGFGGIAQVALWTGLPKSEVRRKAATGEWPSYVIGGERVFDLDELMELAVAPASDDRECNTAKAQADDLTADPPTTSTSRRAR